MMIIQSKSEIDFLNLSVIDSLGTLLVCDNSIATLRSVTVKNIKASQSSLYSIFHFMQGTAVFNTFTFSGASGGSSLPYISFQTQVMATVANM